MKRMQLLALTLVILLIGSIGVVSAATGTNNAGTAGDSPTFTVTDGSGTVLQRTHPTRGDANVRPTQQHIAPAKGAVKTTGAGTRTAGRNPLASGAVLSKAPPSYSWSRDYGGSGYDYALAAQQTSDGGYILAGQTYSWGSGGDAWLVKTDAYGNRLWDYNYGGSGSDEARAVQQTSDGGYILAGETMSYGNGYQLYLVKVNAAGKDIGLQSKSGRQPTWSKTYGGAGYEWGNSVQQTSDGGYIVVGTTASNALMGEQVYALKTDASGNVQWERTYGGNGYDEGRCVREVSGGYVICGYSNSFSGMGVGQAYLIKTDTNGLVMYAGTWETVIGSTAYATFAYQIVQASDGGYVFVGQTNVNGNADMLICKVDASGAWQWSYAYGDSLYDAAYSIAKTSDGGYVLAGALQWADVGGYDYDYYIIKTDAYGIPLWGIDTGTGGADYNDYARSVVQTKDGGIAFAGYNDWQNGGQATLYKYGP
jgi:hypothetical protein